MTMPRIASTRPGEILMTQVTEGVVAVECEGDIVIARCQVRVVALEAGFGPTDVTRIVTAASELARNIFKYAGKGFLQWRTLAEGGRTGLELSFIDNGPGIPDVNLAMQEGYSSSDGLGMGLPGAKRLMDDLSIQSAPGKGTTVTVRKWRRNSA
jgi:serine/threonine-protein kinase RsbT